LGGYDEKRNTEMSKVTKLMGMLGFCDALMCFLISFEFANS